jgi:tetratricopeptide (TPR) repeat protein
MRRFLAFSSRAVLAVVLTATALPSVAHAQDDWSVRRDPFDPQVVARYKAILAKNPADQSALRKLVALYTRHRSLELLLREYEAALARRPDDFATAVVLGHIHLQQGHRDQARTQYERAAKLRPDSTAVLIALGDLDRQDGRVAEARSAYERALPQARGKAGESQLVRALAEIAMGQKDLDAARSYYERYFALAPKDVQARIELGDALAQHGQHQAAIAVLQDANARLRTDPAGQIELMARMGAIHESAGQEEEAVRVYRQALQRAGSAQYLRKELIERILESYRRRQALPDLIAELEKTWPAARRGHFEWDVLARLYEETGDQEKAVAAFRMATKKAPHELDTQRRLIALLENTGREDEALGQYEAVIRVAPGEPRFQIDLAERYWRRGKEKQALELLAKIARRFPSDGGVHTAIADMYTRWGKADLALEAYVRLTRIEPDEVSHLVNLGEQHFLRNDKKQAVAVWKRIIARKTPESYARLGEVYAEHDMLAEALQMYEKAIQMQPLEVAHYKGRAGVHERRRDFAGAVEDWKKVLAMSPTTDAGKPERREARRRIVSLLRRGSNSALTKAKAEWQRAFSTEPPDLEAGYLLVEAHLREHRYGLAHTALERILARDPNDVEALELLAKVAESELKYDEAVEHLERLAELSPSRKRDTYNKIAELKTADRKDDEALEYARKALEASPNDPLAYQRLAERFAEMQRFDDAIAAYEKNVALDPRDFKAYFALAQLYKHGHAPAKAALLYREILRRATDEQVLGRAGREAIDLEEMTRSLGELERMLAPLSFTFAHKPVYRRVLVELYGRYVPELVRTARTGSAEQRSAARAELERLGAHGLKPLLEALNDDTDVQQQRTAVAVLGYLGNKGAAAPLVRLAQKTAPAQQSAARALTPVLEWDVRLDALIAAARLGDAGVIDELIALTRRDGKDAFREAALFGLGRTGDRRAVPTLTAALASDSEADTTLACLGLGQIGQVDKATGDKAGDKDLVQALLAVVRDEQRGDIPRAACALALGYMDRGDRGAAQPGVVDALLAVLAQGNGELQRMAVWALASTGDARVEPALLEVYFLRHEPVRRMIRWALTREAAARHEAAARRPAAARTGATTAASGEHAGEHAGEHTGDIDLASFPRGRDGRYDAAAALKLLLGDVEPAPLPPRLVQRLLTSHEAEIVNGLRRALQQHRDLVIGVLADLDRAPEHLALGELTAGLAGAPAAELAKIRPALAKIGQGIAPALVTLAQHRDAEVRERVMAVAAKIQGADSDKILLAGIDDQQPAVRRAAMRAAAVHVGLYGQSYGQTGRAFTQAVARRLETDDWEGRMDAARALGDFGAHADLAALSKAVGDASAYVRESAVLSIGRLAGAGVERDRAVTALVRAAGDELAVIRLAAVEGLGRADTPRAREQLRAMAERDADARVAQAARRFLHKSKN